MLLLRESQCFTVLSVESTLLSWDCVSVAGKWGEGIFYNLGLNLWIFMGLCLRAMSSRPCHKHLYPSASYSLSWLQHCQLIFWTVDSGFCFPLSWDKKAGRRLMWKKFSSSGWDKAVAKSFLLKNGLLLQRRLQVYFTMLTHPLPLPELQGMFPVSS